MSTIIIYELHVVVCSSVALLASVLLAPETARQTENYQTTGLDESARYVTNEHYTSIVILFFAFFYIAKRDSPYR